MAKAESDVDGETAQAASTGSGGPGPLGRLRAIWANPAYKFVLLFLPYLLAVSLLYPLMVEHYFGFIQVFIDGTAALEHWILSLFTTETKLVDKMVFLDGFAVRRRERPRPRARSSAR